MPQRYEAGTINAPGIAGLGAGARWLLERGVDAVHRHGTELAEHLIAGLARVPGVCVFGPPPAAERTAVVSFGFSGVGPVEVSYVLDEVYGLLVRAGLHCAPDAHRSLGTLEDGGLVRVSFGPFNTAADVDRVLDAARQIAVKADGRRPDVTL